MNWQPDPRMGELERTAVKLLLAVWDIIDSDPWLDALEELAMLDPAIEKMMTEESEFSDEADEAFAAAVDYVGQKLLGILGVALVAEKNGSPNRVADEAFRYLNPNIIGWHAVCGRCGEPFVPADRHDFVHQVREDGTRCGGPGTDIKSFQRAE